MTEEEGLTARIMFRLTEAEKKTLTAKAKKERMTVSTLFRRWVHSLEKDKSAKEKK